MGRLTSCRWRRCSHAEWVAGASRPRSDVLVDPENVASSAESVGGFWLGKASEAVIQGDFHRSEGAESVRPSQPPLTNSSASPSARGTRRTSPSSGACRCPRGPIRPPRRTWGSQPGAWRTRKTPRSPTGRRTQNAAAQACRIRVSSGSILSISAARCSEVEAPRPA